METAHFQEKVDTINSLELEQNLAYFDNKISEMVNQIDFLKDMNINCENYHEDATLMNTKTNIELKQIWDEVQKLTKKEPEVKFNRYKVNV